jgi:hypothetical protein
MGYRTCKQKVKTFSQIYLLPYTWSITKTWLNFLLDHFEEHRKFETNKNNFFSFI